MSDFAKMKNETLREIRGCVVGSEQVDFLCESGRVFRLYHSQNCCESVQVEDIAGDLDDLIGSPLVLCELVTNQDHLPGATQPSDSFTWSFYKMATVKGYVTLRWLGESNGYYGEEAYFEEIQPYPKHLPPRDCLVLLEEPGYEPSLWHARWHDMTKCWWLPPSASPKKLDPSRVITWTELPEVG